jgi:hypothetical protein
MAEVRAMFASHAGAGLIAVHIDSLYRPALEEMEHRTNEMQDTITQQAQRIAELEKDREFLVRLCERVGEGECVPDKDWWRDYLTWTGKHWVLTDEGWEPGESYPADSQDWTGIYEEVNAPERPA